MKKVTLLLFALAGFCLTESYAQQSPVENPHFEFHFPKVKFIPVNSQYQFEPEDIVEPADSAYLFTFSWSSDNSLISITQDGLATTSSTQGKDSLSLRVTRWDNVNRKDTLVEEFKQPVFVTKPLTLANKNDSLLILSRGNIVQLSVSNDETFSSETVLWTVEQGSAVSLIDSIGNPCRFSADALGVAVVSGYISSSPNMKVTSIVYVADSDSRHHIYVPLGKTHQIDPKEIGLSTLDNTPGFSITWYNPYPHIATVDEVKRELTGKKVGVDTLTVVLSSLHSNVEVKVIVHVVEFKFQPAGVRFMGKQSRDSFAISLLPESTELFDARIRWEMSPSTQFQQVAEFYQNEEDLDTTVLRKIDVISRETTGDVYLIASLVASDNIKDTCLIVVGDLTIGPKSGSSTFVGIGKELELALFPHISNASTLPDVRWVVDSEYQDIATVDEHGKVTGLKEGYAIISAIAKNNATWRGSITIQVTDLKIEYVGSNILRPKDSLYMSLRGIPAHLVGWNSSHPDIVAIDDNGVVKTSDKTGHAVVTASLKHMPSLFCSIPVYVSKILLNKTGQQILAPNSSLDFKATIEPETLTPEVRWISTDTEVAVVDNLGHVNTFNKHGYATIVATLVENEAIRASCPVKVGFPVQTVTVASTHTGNFECGKGYQFTATIEPANATNPSIRWSSDNLSVATIDKLGWMKAVGKGTTRIRATDEDSGISHFYDVSVVDPLGLLLNTVSVTLREEESFQLQAHYPDGSYSGAIQWRSSNNEVVTVTEETGVIYGQKLGEAYITATAGGYSAICRVIVKYVLDSIYLNHDTIELNRNTTERFLLTLNFVPESSREFYGIEWSSLDEDIASVVDGQVTPHKEGQTKIIARVDDFEDECLVNIIVPVKNIALNHDSVVIQKGEVIRLLTFVEPADVTVAQRQVKWHSADETIVTVTANGSVEGIRGGKAVVVVTTLDGKFTDSCWVIVENPAESILLHQHTLSLDRGDKEWLMYSIIPENATFRIPAWSSSNKSVATVNEQGIVTAVGSGRAVIVATTQGYNTFTDSCVVTVDNPITSLSLPNHIILERGAEYTLYPSALPNDATSQPLDWQTDNRQVATVSDGLVKAVYKGTVQIRASTAEGKSAETTIIVNIYAGDILLTGVSSIRQGFDFTIAARLFPLEVSEQRIDWKFSTTDGITGDLVDLVDRGNLHCTLRGKKKGKIAIHATSADGRVTKIHTVNILSSPSDGVLPVDGSGLTRDGAVAYSSDGLLHLTGLKDYQGNVFTVYGQSVDAFVIKSDSEYRQLYLPSGIYIFSASNGSERIVTKFFTK
jgi:uncharacterized protein YjdB